MKPLEIFGVTPVRLDITDEASIKEALNLIIGKEIASMCWSIMLAMVHTVQLKM